MAFWGFAWGLLGLAAIPVLVGIYWMRNRFRQQVVSSLLLWVEEKQPREGGRRWDRFKTPLTFFLEFLVLLLLVAAAARPMLRSGQGLRSYTVILDDSWSMQAGGEESARAKAIRSLQRELFGGNDYVTRFMLAGGEPTLIAAPVRSAAEAEVVFKQWQCRSPWANIEDAVALAKRVGSDLSHILVITDHAPSHGIGEGSIRWWAMGESRANIAFINATRTVAQDKQRCLLEIANLSSVKGETELVIDVGEPAGARKNRLSLNPGQIHRMIIELGEDAPVLHARLGDDALDMDNEVVLMPAPTRPVRVAMDLRNGELAEAIGRALEATDMVRLTNVQTELLITDKADGGAPTESQWIVRVQEEDEPQSYLGPFILDKAHPLAEGVYLQGVVWAAGRAGEVAGRPIVMAGNVPLITDREAGGGGREILIRLRPDLSTLTESASWPILWWNILNYRQHETPGLMKVNLRLGTDAIVRLPSQVERIELTTPAGPRPIPQSRQGRLIVRPESAGVYEVTTDKGNFAFAVNATSQDESDLRELSQGRWGTWLDEETIRHEYGNIAWIFLVGAALLLTLHMMVIAKNSKGSGAHGVA